MNKKKKFKNTSPYPDEASKKNRAFPTGNALLYISLSSVDLGRVRPGGAHPVFVHKKNHKLSLWKNGAVALIR